MLPHAPNHSWLLALVCALALSCPAPALAQLGLDIDVDVDVGGDSGIGVDVDLGTEDTGLDVNLGGSSGGSLDLSLTDDSLSLSQAQALAAVQNGRALPLEEILLRAQLLIKGEVIDAQLIAIQDILLYELKVLGKAGDVSELYFYARSGLPVETN